MGKICVAIGKKKLQDGLEAAVGIDGHADVIEIRLDLMENPAVMPFLNDVKGSLLFTNRAQWEGGSFKGDEESRVALLLEAVQGGAAYVDLELQAPQSSQRCLQEVANKNKTRIISSWHNFVDTPPQDELMAILQKMQDSGADIAKIVTTAHDFHDVLAVLNLQEHASKHGMPLIGFCMGDAGKISRVATSLLGGYMTYCALDEGEATAPGQVSFAALGDIYRLLGR